MISFIELMEFDINNVSFFEKPNIPKIDSAMASEENLANQIEALDNKARTAFGRVQNGYDMLGSYTKKALQQAKNAEEVANDNMYLAPFAGVAGAGAIVGAKELYDRHRRKKLNI